MATSLGDGLAGLWDHVAHLGPTVEYVAIASTTSLVLGGVVLPRLLSRGSQAPACPPCPPIPPCQCFCAFGPAPAGSR